METSSLITLRGRRRLRGVLVEAANGLKPCVADAWELLQTFDADTKLHELLIWADQFATHDPGVEWPSEKHTDPVDAICAALDKARDRGRLLTRPTPGSSLCVESFATLGRRACD